MAQTNEADRGRAIQVFGHAPLPPIAGDNGGTMLGAGQIRWTAMLVWFMRTVALVWVVKGLFNWSVILDANPRVADFATLSLVVEASIIFFAAADLIAAIGLWLASPWGGVLWLVCAICEASSPLVGVKSLFASTIGLGLNAGLIAIYFALSWMASRERD